MKFSKLVCIAAIFVHTVSFMHTLRMEMRQPTVSACPLLWISWEKLRWLNTVLSVLKSRGTKVCQLLVITDHKLILGTNEICLSHS